MRYRLMLSLIFCMWTLSLCAAERALSDSKPKSESPAEHYRKHGDDCPAFERTPDKYKASPRLAIYYLMGYRYGARVAIQSGGRATSVYDAFPSNDKQQANAEGYQSGYAELWKAFRELRTRIRHELGDSMSSDFDQFRRTIRETGLLDPTQQQVRQPSSTRGDERPSFGPTPDNYKASRRLLIYYLMGYRIGARVAVIETRSMGIDRDGPSSGDFDPSNDKQQAYADGYRSGKAEMRKAFNELRTRTVREFVSERPLLQQLLRTTQETGTSDVEQQQNRQPAPTHGLVGTPDWFALGKEVYHASEIADAQKKVLSFLKERRWFVHSDLAAPYPATIGDVPATSEVASLDLAVTPTADPKVLQFTLVLTAKRRDLFRSYEHRENNILPVLFALFSDGKAIALPKDLGYTSRGGAWSPDILVKSGKTKTWQVKADTESLLSLLPARTPQTVSAVAAFSESDHEGYPPISLLFPEFPGNDYENREDPDAAPLVRSNIVRLRWDGKTWKHIAPEAAPPAHK
jgi:hypothetical protein